MDLMFSARQLVLLAYTFTAVTVVTHCRVTGSFDMNHYLSTFKAVASHEIVTEPLEDSRQIKDPVFLNHGLSMLNFRLHHPYGFSVYMKDVTESIGVLKIDIFLSCPVQRPDVGSRRWQPDITSYFTKTLNNNTGCVWECNCPYAFVQNGDYIYFTLTINFVNNTQFQIQNRAFLVFRNATSWLRVNTSSRNRLYRIGIKNWPRL